MLHRNIHFIKQLAIKYPLLRWLMLSNDELWSYDVSTPHLENCATARRIYVL